MYQARGSENTVCTKNRQHPCCPLLMKFFRTTSNHTVQHMLGVHKIEPRAERSTGRALQRLTDGFELSSHLTLDWLIKLGRRQRDLAPVDSVDIVRAEDSAEPEEEPSSKGVQRWPNSEYEGFGCN